MSTKVGSTRFWGIFCPLLQKSLGVAPPLHSGLQCSAYQLAVCALYVLWHSDHMCSPGQKICKHLLHCAALPLELDWWYCTCRGPLYCLLLHPQVSSPLTISDIIGFASIWCHQSTLSLLVILDKHVGHPVIKFYVLKPILNFLYLIHRYAYVVLFLISLIIFKIKNVPFYPA